MSRPNILLIISDDVGLDMSTGMYPGMIEQLVSQYGPEGFNHPEWQKIDGHPASTPNLDAFAQQGMRFTANWANPFCSPTRASLLTGLNASQTNVATYADALDQGHDSFVRWLSDAGYATAVFGKWHMAGLPGQGDAPDYPGMKPAEAGFDWFQGNMHAALPTFWEWEEHQQDGSMPANQWRTEQPVPRSLPGIAETRNASVVKVAETIDWIRERERVEPDRPWFGWLAFNLSHATANQQPSAMMIPELDLLNEETQAEVRACGGEFGSRNTGDCSGETQFRAMTNALDTLMGHLLGTLDEVDPNTIVIFVGDNGTPMYGRPQLDHIDNMYITRTARGKGTAYEGGALVPLVVRGPGIAPGSVSDEFTHVVDLFPTILEMAGLDVPEQVSSGADGGQTDLFGVSLMPILYGDSSAVRDPDRGFVITESTNLMTGGTKVVGIRNAHYKLVCTDDAGNCEFYDIAADRLEQYPLEQPASCDTSAQLTTSDPAWHFCFLQDAVANRSLL